MTEPRRVLIDWDYGAHGIWWVLTKEEEAPPARGRRVGIQPPGRLDRARPWSERLTAGLLDDLQAWNSAWDADNAEPRILQERGRALALRVQDELGTNGWEVLYRIGGRIFRVHPPGNWPVATWEQELLGYRPGGKLRAARHWASSNPGSRCAVRAASCAGASQVTPCRYAVASASKHAR